MQNFLNPCSITWIAFSYFRHFVACTIPFVNMNPNIFKASYHLISLTLQLLVLVLVLGCIYSMRIRIFPSIIKLHKLYYDEIHLHITRSINLFSLRLTVGERKD